MISDKILIVDDDKAHLLTLETLIKSWGYSVETAADGTIAVEKVQQNHYDLILMDVRMTKMNGIEALAVITKIKPDIPVLIMTAFSSVKSAVHAMKSGAYDYLTKPLDFDEVRLTIERALSHVALKTENTFLKQELHQRLSHNTIIGESVQINELKKIIAMVGPSEATVLITGESGTGKELVANAVHTLSSRSSRPFITVNCAALNDNLLESELFGHVKGAFTGANTSREGKFISADRGTIFLDEIGETSMAMQAKLLRVIQEGEIQKVGSDTTSHVDIRIIAATNKNLEEEVQTKKFRQDLYYRLNVVKLVVPPLKERGDDILLLSDHFLKKFAEKNRKNIKGFTSDALKMLVAYPWPGNIRELENTVERAVILLTGDRISPKELPPAISGIRYASSEGKPESTALTLDTIEKNAILNALKLSDGNKSEAARILGINRKTLHTRLKTYE
jgi:two-component system response regulator HydG